jgi:DNA-binding MarR family transcriptional regulator
VVNVLGRRDRVPLTHLTVPWINRSNQRISDLAGISDQGQISRLMMRLSEQGLVENAPGRAQGASKQWRLTPHGEAFVTANITLGEPAHQRALPDPRETPTNPPARTRRAAGGVTLALVAGEPASSPFRLTVRTYRVLASIAERETPSFSPSNREISRAAGIRDQGQISKLLRRLEGHGLLVNTGGATAGIPNAWRLTAKGERIVSLSEPAQ